MSDRVLGQVGIGVDFLDVIVFFERLHQSIERLNARWIGDRHCLNGQISNFGAGELQAF